MDVFRQVGKHVLSAVLPRSLIMTRGPRRARFAMRAPGRHLIEVALTFDDGPHPVNTPRVLDALARHGTKATFFVIGQHAARHPDIVRSIVAHGHELGNHTYTHAEPDRTSARELVDEVRRTRLLLEGITGRACTLFRPPRGKLTAPKLSALWREGQTVVLWSLDPGRLARLAREPMVDVCRECTLNAGDIVLLHDDEPHTTSCASALAEQATTEAVSFVPISKYL